MSSDRWRWCSGGVPEGDRLTTLIRDAGNLPSGWVLCGCPTPWTCKDPETVTIWRARRRRAAEPPKRPARNRATYLDRV